MSVGVVFIIFAICLLIAVPISISLGIVAVLPGLFDPSFTASGSFVIRSMLGGIDSFPLLAVPMFVLAGIIMAHGQISKKLFDIFAYFLGNLTAGIPCAVVVTCLFYGAISGSAPATVAAVGSMTIPFLLELGYEKKFYAQVTVFRHYDNTAELVRRNERLVLCADLCSGGGRAERNMAGKQLR